MSQDRPLSRDGSTKINMNHMMIHPTTQMQYNNNNNNNNNLIINKNKTLSMDIANSNSNFLIHKNINAVPSSSSPHDSPMSYNTATSPPNHEILMNGNYTNQHQIVLLTSEKIENSDNEQTKDDEERKINADEELTSLNWLHDKNLLKGINLSCPKVQSPSNQLTNGRLSVVSKSPQNHDEKDDSGVLVENSFNSSLEQNEHYTLSASPKPLNYTKIDNSHVDSNKLLNDKLNSSHNNLNKNSHVDLIKLVSTSQSKNNSTTSTSVTNTTIIKDYYQSSHLNSEESINQIIKSPPIHQHFHKRYLREALKQQDEEKRQQQEQQSQIQNAQLSAYIIAKPQQSDNHRYIFSDDYATNYHHNNNNNAQSNYENSSFEHDMSQKAIDYALPKLNSTASSVASSLSSSPSPKQQQQTKQHPNNIPYDPLVHTTNKPPYSFSSLIFMAIEDSMQKALPVKEIYAWIIQHFPYFKTAPTGWKNSVRHNLSLNKCFQKVEKAANLGKGSLWMVEPQYRPNLIQALTRSPFHPCSTWERQAKNLIKSPNESPGLKTNASARLPNPEHFPFLSRRLAAMESIEDDSNEQSRSNTPMTNFDMLQNFSTNAISVPLLHNNCINNNNSIIINGNLPNSELFNRELNAETIDDVNAATAMLALKHGPKIFTEGIQFVQNDTSSLLKTTSSPSEDHTYSAYGKNGISDNNSNGTSSDAAYESSEENNVVYQFSQPLNDQELEEQRRQAEGVDALLNLAGYNTNTTLLLKRPASNEQEFERKQYFYTTEISPTKSYALTNDNEPLHKKSKSKILRNKLKKKSWSR